MRSQLTRNVFRRLISGRGLFCYCPHNPNPLLIYRKQNTNHHTVPLWSQRTLFAFAKQIAREPKNPSITPGLPKMMELSRMEKIGARPPPPNELKISWQEFFGYKLRNKETINGLQAEHAWRTFNYLKKFSSSKTRDKLEISELRIAICALRRLPEEEIDHHNQLSKALFSELQEDNEDLFQKIQNLECFVETLSLSGDSSEALKLLNTFMLERKNYLASEDMEVASYNTDKLWLYVLKGFSKEQNAVELLHTLDLAKTHGSLYDSAKHEIITTFFAEKNDIEQTKRWFNEPIICNGDSSPQSRTLAAIMQFCIRNDELEWCQEVFKNALSLNSTNGTWDVVLQWAAGVMGKGVEDLESMIKLMVERNRDNKVKWPNSSTFNGLVSLAISNNDPYLAERYLSLGLRFGIRPDAHTFILQMNYRTDAGDLRGAQAAYDALQAEEVLHDEDLPSINKYIRAACACKEPDLHLIKSVIADLDERGKGLRASTVSEIAIVYLTQREIDDLVDILQTNIYHYTLSERGLIRDYFVSFICDRKNSTLKAWDAYNILRQFFDETNTEQRTQIMNSFFERSRCDMACHTFGHMRQNNIPDRKPVLETYVACFEGIARLSDSEYADVIYDMLKLDANIEPNTKLYNALMLAYTSICDGHRAISFWNDIVNRLEGPNYKSLEIVLWACQDLNVGSHTAREIWAMMKRMGVSITRPIFSEYMGSLARDGHWAEVKSMMSRMEQEYCLKPDVRMLGTIYNCLPGESSQDMMQAWAEEYFPEIWAELWNIGRRMVRHKIYPEIRMRQFNLKRDFKAS
ncbi:BgTH12-02859 [Blumeria graminis f. sp. triticale]|uniref:Bgt-276 n=3 Tax=Blumeria graminis TaxID=34373 RepID=A0A381LIV6_BLUGR|nr:hypothetical protein BGT96224_276 [Blumeria graminis f. sp. tritici 96224]CAD6503191.1 BgTH12-02859 [Blumeria graminis f. sp. triticale]VDB89168.1 Bgt-276 [Blumeria graminis f. sp. tritici]